MQPNIFVARGAERGVAVRDDTATSPSTAGLYAARFVPRLWTAMWMCFLAFLERSRFGYETDKRSRTKLSGTDRFRYLVTSLPHLQPPAFWEE